MAGVVDKAQVGAATKNHGVKILSPKPMRSLMASVLVLAKVVAGGVVVMGSSSDADPDAILLKPSNTCCCVCCWSKERPSRGGVKLFTSKVFGSYVSSGFWTDRSISFFQLYVSNWIFVVKNPSSNCKSLKSCRSSSSSVMLDFAKVKIRFLSLYCI